MTVTVASFRQDMPEFASQAAYPNGVINYWLAAANILLGLGAGSPPKVCSFVGQLNADKTVDVTEIDYGSLTMFPLLIEGNGLSPEMVLIGQISGDPGVTGVYQSNVAGTVGPEAMVAIGSLSGAGANPYWGPVSPTADTPPTTLADLATEQWVAHQIVLEKQAIAAAQTGGDPGTKIGIISNKSVNGVSVGFDVGAVTGGNMQENAGYYNQTVYGMRFYRLMKLRGAGPIQIGIGTAPPFLFFNSFGYLGSSNAWAGPSPWPQQGDSGFSS